MRDGGEEERKKEEEDFIEHLLGIYNVTPAPIRPINFLFHTAFLIHPHSNTMKKILFTSGYR